MVMVTCCSCAEPSDQGANDDAKGKHQVQVLERDQIRYHLMMMMTIPGKVQKIRRRRHQSSILSEDHVVNGEYVEKIDKVCHHVWGLAILRILMAMGGSKSPDDSNHLCDLIIGEKVTVLGE